MLDFPCPPISYFAVAFKMDLSVTNMTMTICFRIDDAQV